MANIIYFLVLSAGAQRVTVCHSHTIFHTTLFLRSAVSGLLSISVLSQVLLRLFCIIYTNKLVSLIAARATKDDPNYQGKKPTINIFYSNCSLSTFFLVLSCFYGIHKYKSMELNNFVKWNWQYCFHLFQ